MLRPISRALERKNKTGVERIVVLHGGMVPAPRIALGPKCQIAVIGESCTKSESSILSGLAYWLECKRIVMSVRQFPHFVVRSLIFVSFMTGSNLSVFAEDTNAGKMDYEASCAACHGKNGKGDGPVSEEMRTKPPDLTLIAKRNGGVFPTQVLYQVVDGRRTIRAHGSFEMPIWGFVFRSSGSEDVARERILAIIGYLKNIQEK